MFRKEAKILLVCTLLLAGVLAGWFTGQPKVTSARPVYDECEFEAHCVNDGTVTSAIRVRHVRVSDGAPVEPTSLSDTWTMTATWRNGCDFALRESADVNVSWNGAAWVASCPSCGGASAGDIVAVAACDDGQGCNGGGVSGHEFGYKLIVDLTDVIVPPGGGFGFLAAVEYTRANNPGGTGRWVDTSTCSLSGSTLNANLGANVTDYGAWECPFNCNATGPLVYVSYQ